jgi:hypothetical protein
MKLQFVAAVFLGALSLQNAMAQSVAAPKLNEGDTWSYSVTEEKSVSGVMNSSTKKWEFTVKRVGSKDFSIAYKPVDSNLPPREQLRNLDWSLTENVAGKLTTTGKPFDFPMTEGKKWSIEFTKENPTAKIKSEKSTINYTALGWQDVSTPAGNFHALKIEVETEWTQQFNEVPATATASVAAGQAGSAGVTAATKAYTPAPVSGKAYEVLWYAPEVKKYVKFLYESYQANGQLAKRTTEVLESYKVQ